MHAAREDRSARLQRVLAVLSDGKEHSTLEIVQRAGVCAVNSCVAELRHGGRRIACRQGCDPATGARRWFYRLLEAA